MRSGGVLQGKRACLNCGPAGCSLTAVRGPLCPVRHDNRVLLAILWLRGVPVVAKLDHLTRTIQSTHRGVTSGYRLCCQVVEKSFFPACSAA